MAIYGRALRQRRASDDAFDREARAVAKHKKDDYVTLFAPGTDPTFHMDAQTAKAVKFDGNWYPTAALRTIRAGYAGFLPWASFRLGDELQVAAWAKKN